jgi:hypothetical protein
MRRRVLFVEQNRDGTVGGSHTALLMLVQHLDLSQFEPVVAFYESNALIDAFRRHAHVVLLPAPLPLRIARADAATGVALIAMVALGVRKVANLLMTLGAALWRTVHVLRIRPHLIHVNNHVSPGFEWIVAARLCGGQADRSPARPRDAVVVFDADRPHRLRLENGAGGAGLLGSQIGIVGRAHLRCRRR